MKVFKTMLKADSEDCNFGAAEDFISLFFKLKNGLNK